MPISANCVWQIRSTGNTNNGGGFVTGASGTDFSQQDSAQYALTGVTSAGAGNTVNTASAAANMVGNIAQVISGTNFTAGFYEIVSVVVGTSITFGTNGASASVCSGIGSAGVINIGGAVTMLNKISSASTTAVVAGNMIVIAPGTYTLAGSDTVAASGTVSAPILIVGYNATRPTLTTTGDGYLGRIGARKNGLLDTTNMPVLAYNAAIGLTISGSFVMLRSVKITGNRSGAMLTFSGSSNKAFGVSVQNASTNTLAAGINVGSGHAEECDSALTGASGGATGYGALVGSGWLIRSRVTTGTTTAPGISCNGSSRAATLVGCVVYQCGGVGVNLTSASGQIVMSECTITGCASDGVNIITAATAPQYISNCLITDNGGFGINAVSTSNLVIDVGCDLHNNTSGARGNYGSAAQSFSVIAQQTAGSANSDYVNASGGDYTLNLASAAIDNGFMGTAIGALQRTPTGGGIF